jgi:S-adenosylmethionine:diacylglycerol 3-amino-3-carboxypropyl transferase
MAIFLSNGVVAVLDSVDLSDHLTSATINRVFDELEVTAMGDEAHVFVKGLEASTITSRFSKRYSNVKRTTNFAKRLGYYRSANSKTN